MKTPHPKLLPLLQKYEIDWEVFIKRGRPPLGVRAKRSAIVTELHKSGCSWADMIEITGLSNGAIQRLTEAMWNPESRKRVQEGGKKLGSSWTGKQRPGQLERQWAAGTFDFHRGRLRPPDEIARIKAGWTLACREQAKKHARERIWGVSQVRDKLLAFHRSPEERIRSSQAQVQRMLDNPGKYLRGRAQWVDTPKGTTARAYARSSYEVAAIRLLEANPQVIRYEHECRFVLPDGHWILPDFLVEYQDGHVVLIEVKAGWVFSLPESHQVRKRIQLAQNLAAEHGWGFSTWTEQELKDALKSAA